MIIGGQGPLYREHPPVLSFLTDFDEKVVENILYVRSQLSPKVEKKYQIVSILKQRRRQS